VLCVGRGGNRGEETGTGTVAQGGLRVSRSTAEGAGRDIVVHGQDSGVVQGQQRECGGTGAVRHRRQVGVEKEEKKRKWAPCLSQAALKRTSGARSPVGTVESYRNRDVRSLVFIGERAGRTMPMATGDEGLCSRAYNRPVIL